MQFGPRYAEAGSRSAKQARLARPPDEALRWVVEGLGASELVSLEPLTGGITSAMHRLTLRFGDARQRVVLRRYVFPASLAEVPLAAQHEADALVIAEALPFETPRFIAADVTAAATDVPAVLMSHLPGRVEWTSTKPELWLTAIANLAQQVHALDVGTLPAGTLRPYAHREPDSDEPPRWSKRPGLWARALELARATPTDEAPVLLHRDLHPGNILWEKGTPTGVVDWQSACLGPASLDVGHCRLNLFAYQPGWADSLSTTWEVLSGRRYHPWADVASIVGVLGDLRDDPPPRGVRTTIEGALGRAVAALAG